MTHTEQRNSGSARGANHLVDCVLDVFALLRGLVFGLFVLFFGLVSGCVGVLVGLFGLVGWVVCSANLIAGDHFDA